MLRMRLGTDMRSASVDESPVKTPWNAASPKRISRDEDEEEDKE
jgi:hypothetical protein